MGCGSARRWSQGVRKRPWRTPRTVIHRASVESHQPFGADDGFVLELVADPESCGRLSRISIGVDHTPPRVADFLARRYSVRCMGIAE